MEAATSRITRRRAGPQIEPEKSETKYWRSKTAREVSEMITILVVILVLALIGALPTWPYSRSWGYYPSGGVGLIVLILVILLLMGRV